MPMFDQELLAKLQAENARLVSLLDARRIGVEPTACVQIRGANLSNLGRLDSASERSRHKKNLH
jgi:hypothetical protein